MDSLVLLNVAQVVLVNFFFYNFLNAARVVLTSLFETKEFSEPPRLLSEYEQLNLGLISSHPNLFPANLIHSSNYLKSS